MPKRDLVPAVCILVCRVVEQEKQGKNGQSAEDLCPVGSLQMPTATGGGPGVSFESPV